MGPGVATYYVVKQSPVGGYTIANRRQGPPVAYRTATRVRIRYYDSRLSLWVGYVCFRLASAACEPTPGSTPGPVRGGTTLGIRVPESFQVSFVVGHASGMPEAVTRLTISHCRRHGVIRWTPVVVELGLGLVCHGCRAMAWCLLCPLRLAASHANAAVTDRGDGKAQCLDKHPPTSSCLVNNMRRSSFFRVSNAGWSGSHGNLRVLSTTNEAAPPNTINICRQHHPAFTTTQLCASDIPRKAHSRPPFRDGSPIVTALLSRRLGSFLSSRCVHLLHLSHPRLHQQVGDGLWLPKPYDLVDPVNSNKIDKGPRWDALGLDRIRGTLTLTSPPIEFAVGLRALMYPAARQRPSCSS